MPAAGGQSFPMQSAAAGWMPLESHAAEADLSSCPRIDVKSLEWISRSGKVCCLKWLFHLLWKWVSVLSAIGQTVPEQDLPQPEVLEPKK